MNFSQQSHLKCSKCQDLPKAMTAWPSMRFTQDAQFRKGAVDGNDIMTLEPRAYVDRFGVDGNDKLGALSLKLSLLDISWGVNGLFGYFKLGEAFFSSCFVPDKNDDWLDVPCVTATDRSLSRLSTRTHINKWSRSSASALVRT